MLRSLAILGVLAFLCLGADCHVRGPTPTPEQGGAWGAAIAALLGGPAAAPLGAAVGVLVTTLLGLTVRSSEKGKMEVQHAEEKVQLTDQFAKRLEGIATTQTYRVSEALAKNPPPPSPPPTQEAAP